MPTISFDATTAQATRIGEAVGRIKQLKDAGGQPRAATPAEVKQWIIEYVKFQVIANEREVAEKAIVPTTLDLT